ncbi:transposase, partial [Xanthomonas oryzae pv. oryzae]
MFLAEMDQVVPWKGLLALIEPHYPTSGQPGRQPYPLEMMLRILLFAGLHALSNAPAGEAVSRPESAGPFAHA